MLTTDGRRLRGGGEGQGEVVYNNYGHKSNGELLLGYGFVLPENPADFFHIGLSLYQTPSGQAGEEAGGTSDPGCTTAVQRRVLLAELGLPKDHFIRRGDLLPRDLVAAAAVCLLPTCYAVQLADAAGQCPGQRSAAVEVSTSGSTLPSPAAGADPSAGTSPSGGADRAVSPSTSGGLPKTRQDDTRQNGAEGGKEESLLLDGKRLRELSWTPKGSGPVNQISSASAHVLASRIEVPGVAELAGPGRDRLQDLVTRGPGFPCPPGVLLEVRKVSWGIPLQESATESNFPGCDCGLHAIIDPACCFIALLSLCLLLPRSVKRFTTT